MAAPYASPVTGRAFLRRPAVAVAEARKRAAASLQRARFAASIYQSGAGPRRFTTTERDPLSQARADAAMTADAVIEVELAFRSPASAGKLAHQLQCYAAAATANPSLTGFTLDAVTCVGETFEFSFDAPELQGEVGDACITIVQRTLTGLGLPGDQAVVLNAGSGCRHRYAQDAVTGRLTKTYRPHVLLPHGYEDGIQRLRARHALVRMSFGRPCDTCGKTLEQRSRCKPCTLARNSGNPAHFCFKCRHVIDTPAQAHYRACNGAFAKLCARPRCNQSHTTNTCRGVWSPIEIPANADALILAVAAQAGAHGAPAVPPAPPAAVAFNSNAHRSYADILRRPAPARQPAARAPHPVHPAAAPARQPSNPISEAPTQTEVRLTAMEKTLAAIVAQLTQLTQPSARDRADSPLRKRRNPDTVSASGQDVDQE